MAAGSGDRYRVRLEATERKDVGRCWRSRRTDGTLDSECGRLLIFPELRGDVLREAGGGPARWGCETRSVQGWSTRRSRAGTMACRVDLGVCAVEPIRALGSSHVRFTEFAIGKQNCNI